MIHIRQIKHRTSDNPLNKCVNGKLMLNRFLSVRVHRDEVFGLYYWWNLSMFSLIADKFVVDFKVRQAGRSKMMGD